MVWFSMLQLRTHVLNTTFHGYQLFEQDYYDIKKMLGYVQMEDGSGVGWDIHMTKTTTGDKGDYG